MITHDFSVHDVVEFTTVHKAYGKDVVEKRTALVVNINHVEGRVNYIGHRVDTTMESGAGSFEPSKVGVKRYGFHTDVKVIGRAALPLEGHQSPQPGDRGYDLMC